MTVEKQFTSSVFVCFKDQNEWKIALVLHKKHDKWMLPGGHVESYENPVEAAIREVKEETGLDIEIKPVYSIEKRPLTPTVAQLPLPEFILEEPQAARPNEPEHVHIDFLYTGIANTNKLELNQDEAHQIQWFTKKEIQQLNMYKGLQTLAISILGKLEKNPVTEFPFYARI